MALKVGFDDTLHPTHHIPLNELAEKNAYGYGKIPSRDFLYVGKALAEQDIERVAKKLISDIFVNGRGTAKTLMLSLGEIQKEAIKDAIDMSDIYIPNAPYTVKKKGRDEPLVDTGYMRNNVKVFLETD